MPTALTDADKVIRNDTGKEIAAAIRDLAAPEADKVAYDNTSSGLSADDVQDAIDELASEKMEKFNPTGTGSLSLNRKSGTTTGSYSVAVGYNCEASSNQAYAEGNNTVASGTYSHAQGWGTIANHRGQTALGEYNTEDPSTAAAYSRGNYIEIVGKGTNDANRSNARTLDWNGNETLAGDLKINGNQSLSALWTVLSGLTVLSEKSGSIASFSTDIADKLFSCYVNVTAVQAGSGTPAPDNVRAISGWSECNLSKTGKNIWRYGNVSGTRSVAMANVHFPAGNYVMSGVWTSTDTDDTDCLVLFQYVDDSYQYLYFSRGSRQSKAFTLTQETKSVNFYAARGYDHSAGDTFTASDIQLEFGTSATTFEPFGTTHNIPFNQTVYGGVLDVLSGVLTVTHKEQNLGALTWSYLGTTDENKRFLSNVVSNIKTPPNDNTKADLICEKYATKGYNQAFSTNHSIGVYSGGNILIKDLSYNDATTFQNSLNNVKAVFALATPTVIQLTPTEVKTILGQNNIFADTGDIDLKYLETIGNRLT